MKNLGILEKIQVLRPVCYLITFENYRALLTILDSEAELYNVVFYKYIEGGKKLSGIDRYVCVEKYIIVDQLAEIYNHLREEFYTVWVDKIVWFVNKAQYVEQNNT